MSYAIARAPARCRRSMTFAWRLRRSGHCSFSSSIVRSSTATITTSRALAGSARTLKSASTLASSRRSSRLVAYAARPTAPPRVATARAIAIAGLRRRRATALLRRAEVRPPLDEELGEPGVEMRAGDLGDLGERVLDQ